MLEYKSLGWLNSSIVQTATPKMPILVASPIPSRIRPGLCFKPGRPITTTTLAFWRASRQSPTPRSRARSSTGSRLALGVDTFTDGEGDEEDQDLPRIAAPDFSVASPVSNVLSRPAASADLMS